MLKGLRAKLKASRDRRRQQKLERAAAQRGAADTRPPVVPQGSTLAPPISDDWK
jgi:hypothetical protein